MAKTTDRSRSRRRPSGGKDTGRQPKKQKKVDNFEISPLPTEDPTKHAQPWPRGLLHGLDDAIWAALAHVPRHVFESSQQLTIREALKLIGMEWVATNTTPYRMAMGKPAGKYITAKAIHETNGWQKPAEPLPPITKIDFEDRMLPRDAEFHTLLNNRENILSALDDYGIAVLRGHFRKEVGEKIDEEEKKAKLSSTKGDGVAGKDNGCVSYYTDLRSKTWNGEQTMFLSAFVAGNQLKHAMLTRKAIVLHYKEGAENFAHRDGLDNGEAFPYQGTVMLSEPGVDFTGGEFYVASKDAESGKIVRTKVGFKNSGDLVLFRADKEGGYDHGMLPVRRGSAANCERVAIGLFQKK